MHRMGAVRTPPARRYGKFLNLLDLDSLSCYIKHMKDYPSIPHLNSKKSPFDPNIVYYVFDKLDGSNVRAVWNKKQGFYAFGKRQGLIDSSNPCLEKAPDLITKKYGAALDTLFRHQRWDTATVFFEFLGTSSFAGWHSPTDEHTVVLIDIAVNKKGFLLPRDFCHLLEDKHIEYAPLLYKGFLDQEMLDQVASGVFGGHSLNEGIVAKASRYSTPGVPDVFKLKCDFWYEKLRDKTKNQPGLFNELK